MPNYHDDSFHMSEEELRHLEDEMSRPASRSGDRGQIPDLPSPLYRIRTLHSNETYFAYLPETKRKAAQSVQPAEEAPEEGVAEPSPEYAIAAEAPSGEPLAGEFLLGELLPGETESGEPESRLAAIPPPDDETSTMRHYLETGTLPQGGMVVAPTRYGRDLCEVQGSIRDLGVVNADELVAMDRIATEEDLARHEANLEKEATAFDFCRQRISARNLAMKLVSAHYLLEEPKVLFYFSAESRVDFRELVKDLVAFFKMRIELRQIGVRDEARVTGGCGVCGRVLCCHGVSDKLTPVSIKMAKDQNLSLNSLKISGPCGRLLCCLAYEYSFYRDARRELPNEGARFSYEGVLFRVIEVNPLASSVKMAGEDGRILDMPAARFKYSEGRWHVRD